MNQHRRAAVAAVALVGLLPLAGCGQDDAASEDTTSSSQTTTPQPSPSPSNEASPSSEANPSSDASQEESMTTYLVMLVPVDASSADPAQKKEAVRQQVEGKAAELQERGIEVTQRYTALGGLAVRTTPQEAEKLKADPDVLSLEEDMEVSIPEPPSPSAT